MRNGSFLRLKSVEVGYNLPSGLLSRMKMERFRIYLSGTNLMNFADFDLWDVAMGGNGLGYPLQRVYNLGVNVYFYPNYNDSDCISALYIAYVQSVPSSVQLF